MIYIHKFPREGIVIFFCFQITPLALNKAVKNKSEIMGLVNCHIRDGVALSQYFAWLEYSVINGMNVNEISGAAKLEEFRS